MQGDSVLPRRGGLGAIGFGAVLAVLVFAASCMLGAVPAANAVIGASGSAIAAVAEDAQAPADATPMAIGTQASTTFKVNATSLDLSPKAKNVKGGTDYSTTKKTVNVTAPSNATLTFKSTDPNVATAAWGKWKGNTCPLTITGHARGKATVEVTNSKTSKKLSIKVTVGGYKIGFRLNDPIEKDYVKADGKKGTYRLNNFTLTNLTGKDLTITKKSVFKYWSVDYKKNGDWYYIDKNKRETIRGVPVTVKPGKAKAVSFGKKEYPNKKGKYTDAAYWHKGCMTFKVGSVYKTIYLDEYGMVKKVREGRDF